MMAIDFVPPHLVIVGGSYVGLEFAQMYRRFGAEVTVIEKSPRLIPREDEDVSMAVREIVEREGVAVGTGAECIGVREVARRRARARVLRRGRARDRGNTSAARRRTPPQHRRPRTRSRRHRSGRARLHPDVDDHLRTNVAGIWALGDCNGKGAFTHTAYNDFEIVAANLLDNDPRKVSDRIEAYALYVDPPLGRCGMTEAAAKKAGKRILVGKRPMTKVKRAVEKGETQGFLKIVVDADSKQILGAAILGVGGDEVIHTVLDVMYARAPYTLIQRAMHIHPTVSEYLPTVMGDLKEA